MRLRHEAVLDKAFKDIIMTHSDRLMKLCEVSLIILIHIHLSDIKNTKTTTTEKSSICIFMAF